MKAKVFAPLVSAISRPQMFAVITRLDGSGDATQEFSSRKNAATTCAVVVVGLGVLREKSTLYRSPFCYSVSDRKRPYRS
jgi:hypothetical protein